jgi:hypothetical protein
MSSQYDSTYHYKDNVQGHPKSPVDSMDGVFCNICRGDASSSGNNRASTANRVCSEQFGFKFHCVFGAFVLLQGLL